MVRLLDVAQRRPLLDTATVRRGERAGECYANLKDATVARLERIGWSAPGYEDHDWVAVRQQTRDLATLVAPSGPPVRRTELVASSIK